MRRALLSILALAIVMGLVLSMSAPALAGQIYRFKGTGAYAYWQMYDEATNVYTDIQVYAHESAYQSPPGRPQPSQYAGIHVYQYRYDDYGNWILLSGVYYWGDIPAGCLVVDQKLASARLVADGLEGWDYETGMPVTLDVDVSWAATGPLARQSHKSHYHSPDMNRNYRYTGSSRQATAQGSVHYDGTGIILGASDWAELFSAKEGYVEVNR